MRACTTAWSNRRRRRAIIGVAHMRPIGLVALTGIATAFVCLPLAASLHHWGGAAPISVSWDDERWWVGHRGWFPHHDWFDDGDVAGESGALATRTFAWSGGDRLQL